MDAQELRHVWCLPWFFFLAFGYVGGAWLLVWVVSGLVGGCEINGPGVVGLGDGGVHRCSRRCCLPHTDAPQLLCVM